MTGSTRRLLSAVVVAASACLLSAPAVAFARQPEHAGSSATRTAVGHQQLRRNGRVDLGRLAAGTHRSQVRPDGLTPIPGEHYIATDPDNNSQFSPGGANKGSGTLEGASGDHAVQASPGPGTVGFAGISGIDQASVNNGGDLEPPDQGLCTNGSTVLEYVNNALEAYSTSGEVLAGPIGSPELFGLPSNTFMADPRCYYDQPTHRWFLLEFDIGSTNANGVETVPSVQYVAVSDSADPLGSYHVFSIDTTDTTISGCPCFGDFDQIGADSNGFYISTNEFGLASGAFNGSVIYALGKHALEHAGDLGATLPAVVTYRLINDEFGAPYHVAPSQSPPGSAYADNREYFVESNSDANKGDRLVVYTLNKTQLLASGGTPVLTSTGVDSQPYAFPPNAKLKSGPIPLGDTVGEKKGTLQADFNAIQEVTYAGGKLYAEASTAVSGHRDGVAWWIMTPTAQGNTTAVKINHQGYLSSAADLTYPDIGVDSTGNGYLTFSMSRGGNYPSAGDVRFGPKGPMGSIHVVAEGAGPEDGFTCYAAFVGPGYGGCRWGDYSMAVAASGRIFMATEYIPPTTRDYYTNWGTYVWSAPVR